MRRNYDITNYIKPSESGKRRKFAKISLGGFGSGQVSIRCELSSFLKADFITNEYLLYIFI